METTNIIPVLLAGGSGATLAFSRQSYPKQFSNLIGEHSLFQKMFAALFVRNSIV